jgi:hypothetical protein
MQALLALLEANEEGYLSNYPAFRALLDARARRSKPAAAVDASCSSAAPAARGALVKASDLLLQAKSSGQGQEATRATYPEMNRDPRLFKTPLLSAEGAWDSQLATVREGAGTRLEPFVARLPDYSAEGNNTLVLRAEYFSLPDERSYAAVHIGPVPSGPAPNPVKHFASEVHLHVAFRVDPSKGTGGLRQRFIQTYRTRGTWEEGPNRTERKTWRVGEWPFALRKEFWLRMTLAPEGCYSYVDGVAMGFTPHPTGGATWHPAGDPNLHVVLPVAGDTAEKPTWKVTQAYWGHCAVSEEGLALWQKWRETTGALPQQRKEAIGDELWVTGLPTSAEEADVREAFAAHCTVLRVRLDGRGGAGVQLGGLEGGEASLQKVVSETHRNVVVLGARLNVVQAHRMVQVGGGGGGGGGGGRMID